jgi:hypothetical protein
MKLYSNIILSQIRVVFYCKIYEDSDLLPCYDVKVIAIYAIQAYRGRESIAPLHSLLPSTYDGGWGGGQTFTLAAKAPKKEAPIPI